MNFYNNLLGALSAYPFLFGNGSGNALASAFLAPYLSNANAYGNGLNAGVNPTALGGQLMGGQIQPWFGAMPGGGPSVYMAPQGQSTPFGGLGTLNPGGVGSTIGANGNLVVNSAPNNMLGSLAGSAVTAPNPTSWLGSLGNALSSGMAPAMADLRYF